SGGRLHPPRPGDRPQQDPAGRGDVRATPPGPGTADAADRGFPPGTPGAAGRRRRHRGHPPVRRDAWRAEAGHDHDNELGSGVVPQPRPDARRILRSPRTERTRRNVTGRAGVRSFPGMTDRPIKVLIAKPGLDGHDRGAKVLARGLRDEGFEVVYTGLRQTPEMVVSAALQEDVDVVGLSILSGAHMTLVPKVCRLLKDSKMDDVIVVVGGIIPDDDVPALREAGVAAVFGPGTTIAEVAEFLRANAHPRS